MQALAKQLNQLLGDKAILVVEPRANYRTSIKQFLQNLKARKVKLVTSVAEAKREMLTLKVGLFVVEWSLPETNGLQFCRTLRKEEAYKTTPFLLLSVENLRKDIILASEVKIDGYLLKPFSYEDFCAQIAAIVKQHAGSGPYTSMLENAEQSLLRGEIDDAARTFEIVLQARGTSARALCGMARTCKARGDFDAAMRYLNEATAVNPDYIEAFRAMLEIGEERGDKSSVVATARILHSLSPENPRYTLILAKAHLELNELEDSESFFKRTVTLSPRFAEAYKGLGHVYLAQEEYDKAMKTFHKALDLDQDDVSTLNSLGMTYVRLGQYKEGIDKYLLALKLDPHDARVLFNLGHAYEKRGELERAKWYYAQALIHKSGFDKALRGLERLEKAVDKQSGKLTKGDFTGVDDGEDSSDYDMNSNPFKKSS